MKSDRFLSRLWGTWSDIKPPFGKYRFRNWHAVSLPDVQVYNELKGRSVEKMEGKQSNSKENWKLLNGFFIEKHAFMTFLEVMR